MNFREPVAVSAESEDSHDTVATRRSDWISHFDEFIAGIVAQVTRPAIDPGFSVEPAGGKLRKRSYNVYPAEIDGVPIDRLYLFQHTLGLVNGEWQLRPIFRPDDTPDCVCPHHKLKKCKKMDFSTTDMPARYQNFSLAFFWHGIWIKFRFQRHSEYVSMGIYIDLSGSDELEKREDTDEPRPTLKQQITKQFEKIGDICGTRYHDIIDGTAKKGRSAEDRQELLPAHEFLYETIWQQFEQEILGPCLKLVSSSLEWEQIGRVIYDGRIVLLHLPHQDSKPEDKQPEPPGDPVPVDRAANFLSPAQYKYAELGRLSERIALNNVLGRAAAVTCADTMQPFISAPSAGMDARTEYTANLLLGRRVLYMTSLSAEYIGPDPDDSPTKALLVCKLDHSWQLGRLIDRLFVMGSTRVAALMNLDVLIAAGHDLESMTTDLEQEDRNPRDRWNLDELKAMEHQALKLRTRAAELGRGIDRGIEYRIERSRYYVQQFREEESTLRLDMVEGFQKYSFFVRHRYFTTYDHIDRLGVRLGRFRQALSSLTLRVGYRNDRLLQRRLLRLQIFAEGFLAIPLTYYAGHILESCIDILRLWCSVGDVWYQKVWIIPIVIIPFTIILRVMGHVKELRKLEAIKPG